MHKGAGRMPGFAHLKEPALDAILRYLLKGEDKEVIQTVSGPPSPSTSSTRWMATTSSSTPTATQP